MRRIPQEDIDARHQRIKRAMDVSLKKSYLPKHVQEVQTPYNAYLSVRACPKPSLCSKSAHASSLGHIGPELQ